MRKPVFSFPFVIKDFISVKHKNPCLLKLQRLVIYHMTGFATDIHILHKIGLKSCNVSHSLPFHMLKHRKLSIPNKKFSNLQTACKLPTPHPTSTTKACNIKQYCSIKDREKQALLCLSSISHCIIGNKQTKLEEKSLHLMQI